MTDLAAQDLMQSAPRPLCAYAQCRHLTYPHSNGFADGGRSLILAQTDAMGCALWKHDLVSGEERRLAAWPRSACIGDMLWFDVARNANQLVVVLGNILYLIDLNQSTPSPVPVYQNTVEADANLVPLPSISADGTRVILGRRSGLNGNASVDLIEVSTTNGRSCVLAHFDWPANHFHFCPADENWIGLCHEGPAPQISDRVWAWHAQNAPKGRSLFNNAAARLAVGHERWAFHAPCVYLVAYGESPGGPRGIYRLSDKQSPLHASPYLLSEGNRDWHVCPSQCGRWLVVDTTGPHDAPGRGWENADNTSDVILVDATTGRRRFMARSRFCRDYHLHPHPVFSPDGKVIFFNEAGPDGGHRVSSIPNVWSGAEVDIYSTCPYS